MQPLLLCFLGIIACCGGFEFGPNPFGAGHRRGFSSSRSGVFPVPNVQAPSISVGRNLPGSVRGRVSVWVGIRKRPSAVGDNNNAKITENPLLTTKAPNSVDIKNTQLQEILRQLGILLPGQTTSSSAAPSSSTSASSSSSSSSSTTKKSEETEKTSTPRPSASSSAAPSSSTSASSSSSSSSSTTKKSEETEKTSTPRPSASSSAAPSSSTSASSSSSSSSSTTEKSEETEKTSAPRESASSSTAPSSSTSASSGSSSSSSTTEKNEETEETSTPGQTASSSAAPSSSTSASSSSSSSSSTTEKNEETEETSTPGQTASSSAAPSSSTSASSSSSSSASPTSTQSTGASSDSDSTEPAQNSPRSGNENVIRVPRQIQLPSLTQVDNILRSIPRVPPMSQVTIPELPPLPDTSSLPAVPGLANAIEQARDHVLKEIGGGMDVVDGLQEAMSRAFVSNDPPGAIRQLIQTVVSAYNLVAQNCPLFIAKAFILQEGISLAQQIAQALSNISIEAGITIST